MKTVLVTGATGFIGKELCIYLVENGFKVRGLSRNVIHTDHVSWVLGDITKPESLIGICEGVDIVFHLAGFAHADEENNSEFKNQHEQINYQGTINVLNEANRAKVKRFVYFSSVKACADHDECVDESWTTWPTDAYGIAKRQAEEAVLSLSSEPIILRPTLVYGEGCKGNLEVMITAIVKGYFPTPPPIQNQKSMISLRDLCRVALLAALAKNPRSKIYIVTDDHFYSTRQIVMMIRSALGMPKSRVYLPYWIWCVLAKIGDLAQRLMQRRLPVNTKKIKKLFSNAAYTSQMIKNELQFEPQVSLQDALPLMVKAQKGR